MVEKCDTLKNKQRNTRRKKTVKIVRIVRIVSREKTLLFQGPDVVYYLKTKTTFLG